MALFRLGASHLTLLEHILTISYHDREARQATDNVLMSEELPKYEHGKRKACDVPDEARSLKKQKTPGRAASGDRVSRYGAIWPAEGFAPQDIGIVAHWQLQEADTFSRSNHLMSSSSESSSCHWQIPSEASSPRDARKSLAADVMASNSPWTYCNTSSNLVEVSGTENFQYVESGSFKTVPESELGQGGPAEGFYPQGSHWQDRKSVV